PLAEDVTVADVAADLGYPLLIVARAGLGTVNHTLLTVAVARSRGLAIAGVLLNQIDKPEPEAATNAAMIEDYGNVPVLGRLTPHGPLPAGGYWGELLKASENHRQPDA
ncbi:MAG: AAA family ATPase, partial [Planctomycetota bacterium]